MKHRQLTRLSCPRLPPQLICVVRGAKVSSSCATGALSSCNRFASLTDLAAPAHQQHSRIRLVLNAQENNTLKGALAAFSLKEHIVALQHAISQNHVANNVPLPPALHACNGQAHGDPHAKAAK